MANLRLDKINKEYIKGVQILKNITLDIDDGELVVILGPSGCGKTTLLNIIAGVETISDGKVLIDGKDGALLTAQQRNVAVVFQDYALYPMMSVYENIAFPLKNFKVAKEEIRPIVENVASLLGISDILRSNVNKISGGQKQRVALARAIVRKPNILLLDEPLSNVDAYLKDSIKNELLKLHRKTKTTMIYVTHDQNEALSIATRIAIMNDGEIVQVSSPEEIYNSPKNEFVATFIGNPRMNLICGLTKSEVLKICDKYSESQLCNYTSPTLFDLGFRPSDIIVDNSSSMIATVIEKEFLGSSYLFKCSLMGTSNTVSLVLHRNFPINSEIRIRIVKVYLFDSKNKTLLTGVNHEKNSHS